MVWVMVKGFGVLHCILLFERNKGNIEIELLIFTGKDDDN